MQRRNGKDLGPQCLVQRTPTQLTGGILGLCTFDGALSHPGAAAVPAQALGALCLFLSSTQGNHEIRTIRWDKEGEEEAESQQN